MKDASSNPESSKRNEAKGDGRTNSNEINTGCRFCDLRNHNSEECMCKTHCENCGYNNHSTQECKREPLWNMGPELCAAQVENQSFFFIDENIDPRASMEKSTTAIITVLRGEVNAKQIEAEFQNTVSSKVWRWSARKLAENKYSLRFPDAHMVQVYSNFKCLGMKNVDAQIMVEPWSPSAGAKGELQQAWFRVKGIPSDQRSMKTIAKVGGLVGKTVEIDEKTRFRNDYVRVKIACRDISQVPAVAESSLGMKIYDFSFEREVPEEHHNERLRVGVPAEAPPPP